MATMKSLVKEVKDITECPICTEMFSNPKMLPCFHTFCLQCIEQYCEDNEEGDTMPCPMCRKEFIVPTGGLSKLNVNFFMERLIAAQSASATSSSHVLDCDVCLAVKQSKVEASSFCMECQENMCDQCSTMHKGMKISLHHHVSTIGDASDVEAIKNKIRRTFCDKHPSEEIKVFCRDCKIPICATCLIAKHIKHKCCEIGEIVEQFKIGFRQHSDDVSKLLTSFKEQSDRVDEQLASFAVCIDTTEKNILQRSEEIKHKVDMHTQALLVKLSSHKTHFLKNLETTKEEFQRNMMICENFVSYCQKAIEEADAVESIRMADEMRTRAEELKRQPISKCSNLPDIEFHPSDLDVATNSHNIIGNIHVKHSLKFIPQGFALSNGELFCIFPDFPDIDVYNIETFAFQRTISVEGMKHPFDIVASESFLYVSEHEDKLIHKIQLPEETVSNWSVDGTLLILSIYKNGNLIVASWDPDKIFEYASDGTCVREIAVDRIDPELVGLQHAIQLEGDKFLVCHSAEVTHHRVCIIDNTGRVIKCYGGNRGTGKGELNVPYHMAIGRNCSILVADHLNNRVVQLNSSLEYMNEFLGFKEPFKLHINEKLGRLYVIRLNDQIITITDMY